MKFTFKPSPNYRGPLSTQRIMFELTLAIMAVLSFSLYYYYTALGADYGNHALLMILTAVGVSILTEVVWALAFKKKVIQYLKGSFPWVTGLLFVAMMGVNKPLYVIAVGSFVAIFIGKLLFGGFGHNIFNPAGVGRVVVVLSFGGFIVNSFPDIITGATPNQMMEKLGWVITNPEAVNAFLAKFGGLQNLAMGWYSGALGETSTLLIAAVGIYMAIRKIIDWRIPVVYMGSLFAFASVLALMKGMGLWYPIFHVVTGGAMFGAVFMLTDPVTSPTSIPGRIIFAFGAALLTFIIRVKANLPEGVIRSILFMNMMTPLIDSAMDGWPLKQIKKYVIVFTTVAAIGFATVGAVGLVVHYNAPEEPVEPPVVVITLGDPINIYEVSLPDKALITNTVVAGDVTTFTVSSDGYAVLEEEEGEGTPNVYEIKINTVTKTIVSVAYITFSDTKRIGDKTNSEIFLVQFKDLVIDDTSISVDVATGATYSSQSVIRAVLAAIKGVK